MSRPVFTTSEQELIDRKRLTPRPSIFRNGNEQEISEEFEEYLILAPVAKKGEAAAWINFYLIQLPAVSTKKLVLADMVFDEAADYAVRFASSEPLLVGYQLMADGLDSSRFAAVPEVQQFLADMDLSLGELGSARDLAEYQKALLEFYIQQLTSMHEEDDLRRTLRSYLFALLAYI